MNILSISILKIHSVQEGKHVVLVDCDTACYGGTTEHNKVCFHKYRWERIKIQMNYLENEGHDAQSFEYFEKLSDEEYHKRFERTLSEYSDIELAEEINKRASNRLFHNIKFEVKVVGGERPW